MHRSNSNLRVRLGVNFSRCARALRMPHKQTRTRMCRNASLFRLCVCVLLSEVEVCRSKFAWCESTRMFVMQIRSRVAFVVSRCGAHCTREKTYAFVSHRISAAYPWARGAPAGAPAAVMEECARQHEVSTVRTHTYATSVRRSTQGMAACTPNAFQDPPRRKRKKKLFTNFGQE